MEGRDILKPLLREARLISADPGPTQLQVSRTTYPKASVRLFIWRSIQ